MTLEEIRKWKEFENAVDNEHCKEIADQLDKARTVYYYTSNGMKTTEETNVLDLGEWIDGICYFDCKDQFIDWLFNENYESIDVSIRCYLLTQAISEVLPEYTEEFIEAHTDLVEFEKE